MKYLATGVVAVVVIHLGPTRGLVEVPACDDTTR
jgi:hypothetical protein